MPNVRRCPRRPPPTHIEERSPERRAQQQRDDRLNAGHPRGHIDCGPVTVSRETAEHAESQPPNGVLDRQAAGSVCVGEAPEGLRVRRVGLHVCAIEATGTPARALVLSQLIHWLTGCSRQGRPRAHPAEPARGLPRPWVAKSAVGLAAETSLTPKQVEHAIRWLRDHGFIGTAVKKFAGRPRLHLWEGDVLERVLDGRSRRVSFMLWTHLVTGDVNAGIVLSQVVYWFTRHNRRGRPLAKSRHELAEETGLSLDQVKRALRALRDQGFITTDQHLFGEKNVNYVVVNEDMCIEAVLKIENPSRILRATDEGATTAPPGGAVSGDQVAQ